MGKRWFSLYVPRIPYREEKPEPVHGTDENGDCHCEDCGCGEKYPASDALAEDRLDAGEEPAPGAMGDPSPDDPENLEELMTWEPAWEDSILDSGRGK